MRCFTYGVFFKKYNTIHLYFLYFTVNMISSCTYAAMKSKIIRFKNVRLLYCPLLLRLRHSRTKHGVTVSSSLFRGREDNPSAVLLHLRGQRRDFFFFLSFSTFFLMGWTAGFYRIYQGEERTAVYCARYVPACCEAKVDLNGRDGQCLSWNRWGH